METAPNTIRIGSLVSVPAPELLPVVYYDTGTIAGLSSTSWQWDIPNDDFTWFLADFSTYMAPTGIMVARIALDGTDIFRCERFFMVQYPNLIQRPAFIDLGAKTAPITFCQRRADRPFIIANGTTILVTLANIYAGVETAIWAMTFYRRPS